MASRRKTGASPINYASTINYYQHNKKSPHIVNTGLDTIVFDLGLSLAEVHSFMKHYSAYTPNTSNFYFSLPSYPGLNFQGVLHHTKYGTALNISIDSEELPNFPAFQIYYNRASKVVKGMTKITLYGLLFRFCELSKIDWRKLSQEASDYLKVGRTLLDCRVMRVDYKADILSLRPQDFYDRLRRYNKRKKTLIGQRENTIINGGKLETIYIGSRKSRFAFCRVYDKFIDTTKKEKEAFYYDYPEPTTRVEWQFGSQFIGSMKFDNLMHKIASYVGFKSLYTGNYFVADRYDESVIINQEQYYENFIKRGKKLVVNGIPLAYAIQELEEFEKYNYKMLVHSRFLYSIPIEKKFLYTNLLH